MEENDWDFQDLFKRIEDEEDEELLRWVYHERNQETLAAARKQLEGLGLGWVFDCPGIEIEEVTE